jgi:hypothetical protein
MIGLCGLVFSLSALNLGTEKSFRVRWIHNLERGHALMMLIMRVQ